MRRWLSGTLLAIFQMAFLAVPFAYAQENATATPEQLSQQAASFRRIIALLEADVAALEGEIKSANEDLRAVETQREVARNEVNDAYAERDRLQSAIDAGKAAMAELAKTREAVNADRVRAASSLEVTRAELATLTETRAAIMAEITTAQKQLAALNDRAVDAGRLEQVQVVERRLAEAQEELDSINEALAKARAEKDDLQAKGAALNDQARATTERLAAGVAELAKLDGTLAMRREEVAKAEDAVEEALSRTVQTKATLTDTETLLAERQAAIEALRASESEVADRVSLLKNDSAALEKRIAAQNEKIASLNQDFEAKRAVLEGLIGDIAALSEERATAAAVESELSETLAAVERHREQIAAAEVRLENLSAQESASAATLANLDAEIKGRSNVLDELKSADAQLAKRQADLETLQSRLAELDEAAKAVETGNADLAELQAAAAEKQAEIDRLAVQKAEFEEQLEGLDTRFADTQTRAEALDIEIANGESRLQGIQAEEARLADTLATFEAKIANSRQTAVDVEEGAAAAAARQADLLAQIEALKRQITALLTDASDAETVQQQWQTKADAAEAQFIEISSDIDEALATRSSLKAETVALRLEAVEITQRLADERKLTDRQVQVAADEVARAEATAADFAARVAVAREELAQLVAEAAEIAQRIGQDRDAAAELATTRTALAAEITALQDARDAVRVELDTLRLQSAVLQNQLEDPNSRDASGENAPVSGAPESTTGSRRDPTLVASAIRLAPGLPPPDSAETARLQQALINGRCTTDVLEDIFGTINRQTLLSLVRSLGPC